jgi:hypothetical protein
LRSPRCGWLHAVATRTATPLERFLVISEDDWNDAMGDSVAVPVYHYEDAHESRFLVAVAESLWADCTKVLSVDHRLIGHPVQRCTQPPWVKARLGVREFLDIDRRIAIGPKPSPHADREEWCPRQHDIHFVSNPRISAQDKLYAVISDDGWNSAPGVKRAACVRLTSHTKPQRVRWEVPVARSWVVAGDIYQLAYHRFEQSAPRGNYPKRMTDAESAALADKQKVTLSLR